MPSYYCLFQLADGGDTIYSGPHMDWQDAMKVAERCVHLGFVFKGVTEDVPFSDDNPRLSGPLPD